MKFSRRTERKDYHMIEEGNIQCQQMIQDEKQQYSRGKRFSGVRVSPSEREHVRGRLAVEAV
jgi:hypothetical protein